MRPTLSVAPMLNCTDRHERFLLRTISLHAELYTEMIVANTLKHKEPARWLNYNPIEHPVILQLAGDNPETLAFATRLAADWGYDGVNLNVGCPSSKVKSGHFGACLFLEPTLVANCIATMSTATRNITLSVKTRIGVDTHDTYSHLYEFISQVSLSGCNTFILHARKAWLTGLNPAQNRKVPPLNYSVVHQLKRDFPALNIIINGGLDSVEQAWQTCKECQLDGAMIGRAAYANPYIIAGADKVFYQDKREIPGIFDLLTKFIDYLQAEHVQGGEFRAVKRHIQGLFHGQPGAKIWRKLLGEAPDIRSLDKIVTKMSKLDACCRTSKT